MKLFYIPGACSLVPHAALREAQLPFDLELVGFANPATLEPTSMLSADGKAQPYVTVLPGKILYRSVNPKGMVPALEVSPGEVITEGSAINQYIADQAPGAAIMAPPGDPDRYRCLEFLDSFGRHLHKGVHNLMHTPLPPEIRRAGLMRLVTRMDWAAAFLKERPYLLSEFSVADIYLFSNWSVLRLIQGRVMGVSPDFVRYPWMHDYLERVRNRPSVRAAIIAEGQEDRFLSAYV